ncbi:spore germination protein [Pontibacillus sp. HMF3514]|uniref:spore germination protein n=1 Tax=Pontibacillus sp. HMF3514 TaxID=2692425 RepID=UPI0013203118|nr:spore germination protein [Pontibacillus sp. HMF3514]QHE51258.1 spore germination protein [Pontibacillus sp. HMF3514]
MRSRKGKSKKQNHIITDVHDYTQIQINHDIHANIEQLKYLLGDSPDLVARIEQDSPVPYAYAYLKSLADENSVNEFVVQPLINWDKPTEQYNHNLSSIHLIKKHIAVTCAFKTNSRFQEVVDSILDGAVVLFIQDSSLSLEIPVEENPGFRKIEEPKIQTVVRGPREGFIEDLDSNISLIRRRIRSPKLRFIPMKVGKETSTKIVVSYLEGKEDQDVLSTVMERLRKVDKNKILDSGMLEELIEDPGYTPFPTIKATERPDSVAGEILDGRIIIVVDGSPFVLITPATFVSFFHSAEDYYEKFDLATFLRLIRLLAFWVSIALPSTYIAVTTFHAELLPTNILINLAAQREGVPFPAFLEVFMMEMIFELLREAGIRMPRPIGSAISIVGALVIGEAAVQAGLISPAMVIVVSLTAISSFIAPYYSFSGTVRLLRFLFILFATFGGFFGMSVLTVAMIIHLSNVTSFGKSYLAPVAPFSLPRMKDVLIRFPQWWDKTPLYKFLQKVKKRARRFEQ